jgi:hypothetical protein
MTEVLSPFLPGTRIQYAWDSTCLNALKTCPRLYYYTILCGYTTEEENYHLRFGIEFHKTLEGYDKHRALGQKPKAAYRSAIWDLLVRIRDWKVDESTPAGTYKNRRTLIALCIDYLDKFSLNDPAKTFHLENGKPAVELSFRFELGWGPKEGPDKIERQPYLLCGHLDRVVTLNDDQFVMDRKTSKTTLGEYYFNQYSPNNQMTLYTIAGQVILNSPIKGVIIDGAQILLEKPNVFKRGFTHRTQEQLDEWMGDLRYWLGLAETFAVNNYWPMNDTSCDKFGGCKFREVCSKSPNVRGVYLESNFKQLPEDERWNPLKER